MQPSHTSNYAYLSSRLESGAKALIHSPIRLILTFLYFLALSIALAYSSTPADTLLDKLNQAIAIPVLVLGGALVYVAALLFSAVPKGTYKMVKAFEVVGLKNAYGQTPMLSKRSRKGKVELLEFIGYGVSMEDVQNKQERLQTAANLRILSVEEGEQAEHFILKVLPGTAKLPDLLPFPATLPDDKDKIYLGESLEGVVTWDYRSISHLLTGGATGSGKTSLVRVILTQLLEDESCMVFLVDMKGGTDFADLDFSNGGKIISEPEEAAELLRLTVEELEARKKAFASVTQNGQPVACPDLDTYNRLNPEKPVVRIFLAVDELAELTDITGMTKEDKARSAEMVAALSKIARLGRAFGIHLILSTQRPDANVVPGQIKNNVDFRICGKADNVLSTIVLDNGDAADKIPKDSHGLFLTHDGTLFRGYYLKPNN